MLLPASARAREKATRTNVESLRKSKNVPMRVVFPAPDGMEPLTRRSTVKARLYRTAVTVGVVALMLEGLGAGWKWG